MIFKLSSRHAIRGFIIVAMGRSRYTSVARCGKDSDNKNDDLSDERRARVTCWLLRAVYTLSRLYVITQQYKLFCLFPKMQS